MTYRQDDVSDVIAVVTASMRGEIEEAIEYLEDLHSDWVTNVQKNLINPDRFHEPECPELREAISTMTALII